ncbi:hypothetical protein [Sphingomonas sp.]|uniref:hypothetical protein n=1 Tax=Sphingomonas sp. TaxID=28214 RepID=UPI0025F2D706|nr:hypothetical protein [Sphingomonas sp.]
MKTMTKFLAAASAIALTALGSGPAFAAGTAAGSNIVNNVVVNYNVGAVAQTAINASNTFVVDRKITLTVAPVGTTTTNVSPGQMAAVTTFTVTNTSNATLDFGLSLAQQVGGAAPHGGTDNFDVTSPIFYLDNGDGTFNAATDTVITYLDEVAADSSKTVFVVVNIPIGRATNDVAAVTLTAQADNGGTAGSQGAVLTETVGANTALMDTVFADTAGATDAARDGLFSAKNDYTVSAAALSVTKTATIVSDPLNGTTNPKMIPGAVVSYCILVSNAAGGADASGVAISDPLPSQTTYDGTGIFINSTAGTCSGGTNSGTIAGTTVSGTISTVPAGTTRTLYFRTTIN